MTQNERISLPIWKKILILLISILTFAIQLALLIVFLNVYINYASLANKGVGLIYILSVVVGFLYVLYIIHKPISANFKVTWTILILSFPIPFCVLYTLNSFSKRLSKRKRKKIEKILHPCDELGDIYDLLKDDKQGANLARVVQHQTYAPVYKNCKFTFFHDPYEKLIDFKEELSKASKYILLEYFIIGAGYLMNDIIPILQQKGKEGVKIYILYDDIGSKGVMTPKLLSTLSSIPNLIIDNFQPLGLNINLLVNYRDHRKIAIIDGRVAYCGGDNLADEYIHKKERFGYWRDNCGKFEGKIVNSFVKLFEEMWYISTKQNLDFEEYNHPIMISNDYMLAFGDGPTNNQDPAYDLFSLLISCAKKSIYISTPYFIIDDSMISLIALKAKSGVDVKILMPKIPDKKTAFYMGRENYRRILEAGGNIYEYTPGFNHAKNVIIDNTYAFIGTINIDYRSMFLHYECGALLINTPSIKDMNEDFISAVSVSEKVDYDKWKKRPLYQKIIAFLLNLFATMF